MNYEIDSVLKTQVSCLTGVDKPRPFEKSVEESQRSADESRRLTNMLATIFSVL